MTKTEILALLSETTEGKEVVQELTGSLQSNRNEILGEKRKLQDSLQAINTKLGELESEGEKLKAENQSLTFSQAIDNVLIQIGVMAQHGRAVRALINSENLHVEVKDGKKIVIVGSGQDAKPIEVWAAEWAGTDEGKSYCSSPLNSGGGALGSHEVGSSGFNLEGKTPEQILENLDKISKRI